ncbi:MAG TPA: hypothetical protein VMM93_04805, partial [Vicinamibacterales bacterium]|nr:hypothetical protein [Vicinamibacterales bacterium]
MQQPGAREPGGTPGEVFLEIAENGRAAGGAERPLQDTRGQALAEPGDHRSCSSPAVMAETTRTEARAAWTPNG